MVNRWDKLLIGCILLLSLSLFLGTRHLVQAFDSKEAQAVFYYKDQEVQRINMSQRGFYTVQGDLGPVIIEIQEGKVRIAEEKSPLHYCSMQGWVNTTNTPIICLPNRVVVVVESTVMTETDVDLR